MTGLVSGLAATLGAVAIASAAEPSDTPPLSSDWVFEARDARLYYPEAAQRRKVEGFVLLKCNVRPPGRLDRCKVAKEEPGRFGFGAAALRMAPYFKKRTPSVTEGEVADIPLHFRLPKVAALVTLKTFRIQAAGAPVGHADVSCQVFEDRIGDCFVVRADPPELTPYALKAVDGFAPGSLKPGLRFTLPLDFGPP